MGKKRKPLLADSGIVHLKSSFVHPVDESGLLTTVGGRQEQPLMLASGNYGYGIPASVAVKNVEAAAALQDAEVDPDVLMVREIVSAVTRGELRAFIKYFLTHFMEEESVNL